MRCVFCFLARPFTISFCVLVSRIESGFRLAMFGALIPFSILIIVFLSLAYSSCFCCCLRFLFLLLWSIFSHFRPFSLFRVTFGSVFCVALFASSSVMLLFPRVLFLGAQLLMFPVSAFRPKCPPMPFPRPHLACMFFVGRLRPGPPIIRGALHCVIAILKL